jgi:hypothetical protein
MACTDVWPQEEAENSVKQQFSAVAFNTLLYYLAQLKLLLLLLLLLQLC